MNSYIPSFFFFTPFLFRFFCLSMLCSLLARFVTPCFALCVTPYVSYSLFYSILSMTMLCSSPPVDYVFHVPLPCFASPRHDFFNLCFDAFPTSLELFAFFDASFYALSVLSLCTCILSPNAKRLGD